MTPLAITTSQLFLVLGACVLTAALFTYQHPLFRRLGMAGILLSSFLAGWLFTDSIAAGVALALLWFFLPWIELLTRVRRLRLPIENQLRSQPPPSRQVFPNLQDITSEVEGAGFEFVEDTGWSHDDQRQSYRLFYHPAKHLQAAICLVEQAGISFYFLTISSRLKDGSLWITWNYPFSETLRHPPHQHLRRHPATEGPIELLQFHAEFLAQRGIDDSQIEPQSAAELHHNLQRDMHQRIAHNLRIGLLSHAGDSQVRYTWRGLFFLWLQFLRDLVRLS